MTITKYKETSKCAPINPIESFIILATVLVTLEIEGSNKKVKCRAILDSASQLSFVSTTIFNKFGIPGTSTHLEVEGIGKSKKGCNKKTNLKLTAVSSDFSIELNDVLILNTITSKHPCVNLDPKEFDIPNTLTLADPEFFESKEVGVLLGADVVGRVLTAGNIALGENKPSLQNTRFGWVVIGEVLITHSSQYFCGIVTSSSSSIETTENGEKDQSQTVKSFWESQNGVSFSKLRDKENFLCESLFSKTTLINKNRRFVVRFPLLGTQGY